MRESSASRPNLASWIVGRPTCGARLRLFCLPYAGSGAAVFHGYRRRLGRTVDVCAIQLPGRETRLAECAITNQEVLLSSIERAVTPLMDVPCALWGCSFGGTLAFELARRLHRTGSVELRRLIVAAVRAPQCPDLRRPIQALTDDAFIDAISKRYSSTRLAALRGTELLRLCLPALRADVTVTENYTYRPAAPLDCAISAFGGQSDTAVPESDITAWRSQTSADFKLRMLPGGHFFYEEDPERFTRLLLEDLGL